MAAILYSAILNSAILDSAIFLKFLTPTNSDLTQTHSIWLKLDLFSAHLEFCSNSWILPFWIQPSLVNLMILLNSVSSWHLPRLVPSHLHKKLHSFILTQLDDGSHLEFCHVGFRHCHLGFRHLVIFSQIHSKTLSSPPWLWLWSQTNSIWLKLIYSHSLNLMMAAFILNSAILNSAGLDSDTMFSSLDSLHLSFPLKLIHSHTCQDCVCQPFAQKNFTCSFWLNLMMAAILNSAMLDSDTAILDSDTLLSSLRFTQKHSLSTLTLTQTNSIWLKLIHSHTNLMMAAILNSAILNSFHLGFSHLSFSSQTHSSHLPRLVPNYLHKKTSFIHSDSTWWWQPSWTLNSWIQPFSHKE